MASQMKSRWADNENDAALEAQRKLEKEEKKKRARAEKQRAAELSARNLRNAAPLDDERPVADPENKYSGLAERPSKRRRISPEPASHPQVTTNNNNNKNNNHRQLLRFPTWEWGPCRHVDNFEKLNHIEEGSYGWVSRARETATGEVVALKKLKVDNPIDGFPVTGLREIQTLMASRHTNIVVLREVVKGDNLNE